MAEKITNWTLLKYIRDGKVSSGVERLVLIALVMRANALKNFTCYPSYAQIMEDSVVCRSTVKSAVRDLEQAGWIKRKTRGRKSNLFFINVHQLKVAAEEELVKRGEGYPEESEDHFGVNTLACAGVGDESLDNTDGLDLEPAIDIPDWLHHCRDEGAVVKAVHQLWNQHPTFVDPRGIEFVASDIQACIELAETPFRCAHVLHFINEDDGIREAVGKSRKLGLYIKKCFPAWFAAYKDRLVGTDYEGEKP